MPQLITVDKRTLALLSLLAIQEEVSPETLLDRLIKEEGEKKHFVWSPTEQKYVQAEPDLQNQELQEHGT